MGDAPTPGNYPVLGSPWEAPARHWRLDSQFKATEELAEGRRPSGAYLPAPLPKRPGTLLGPSTNLPPHRRVNRIRAAVDEWRAAGWLGVSSATRTLLDHWSGEGAEPRPFFCQREAVETLIWLHEAAGEIRGELEAVSREANEGIERMAVKMATGTGKTLAMAMTIAWWSLWRGGGSDVLLIAPNLTVRDRLAELDPATDKGRDLYAGLLPPTLLARFNPPVSILNFQKFRRGDVLEVEGGETASGTVKKLLRRGGKDPKWEETPVEMLDRLLGHDHRARPLLVLNDEGHHCYKPPPQPKKAVGEEKELEEGAALWFNALRSLRDAGRLAAAFDFSATPMYLRLPPGVRTPVFPWIVSDYPLIEAVEAGLTKVPRVPVADDTGAEEPLWRNIYDNTAKKTLDGDDLPDTVEAPLRQLYEHYRETDEKYSPRIPVMIVVANTVENATELYRHLAGEETEDGRFVPGRLPLFSNVRADGSGWAEEQPTILVHSKLDSPEELSGNLAKLIEKQGERLAPDATTRVERIRQLRKIANTVGKRPELNDQDPTGERVRCVISVSMLSEGWDTRTVTHIFGFRKFGSELLCEQVAGRSLRRSAYDDFVDEENSRLRVEVSNIFGVPFSFMRAVGEAPLPPPDPYAVFSVPDRERFRIRFPNLAGYRWELPSERLRLDPAAVRRFTLQEELWAAESIVWAGVEIPETTTVAGVVGPEVTFFDKRREKELHWRLAREVVRAAEEADTDSRRRRVRFGDAVRATREWLDHPAVECRSFGELARTHQMSRAARDILEACSRGPDGAPHVLPVFADEQDPAVARWSDTGSVRYLTARRLVRDTVRSEVNRAPCDSEPELGVAAALDASPSVTAWVRNDRLGWSIPYLAPDGATRRYQPDFVARLENGEYLVVEYKGRPGPDSLAKRRDAENWWIPALRNSDDPDTPGVWHFCELTDPKSIAADLKRAIAATKGTR